MDYCPNNSANNKKLWRILIGTVYVKKFNERGNGLLRLADRCLGIPLIYLISPFGHSGQEKARKRIFPAKTGIFCPGAIGDLLFTSILIDGIRRSEPQAFVEIIASEANAQALPFLQADRNSIFPITRPDKIINYIRRQNFDIFIDTSQWSRLGALISAFSGARLTVGFNTPSQHRHMLYDIPVKHSSNVHELENFLALGRSVWPDFSGKPVLRVPKSLTKRKFICCHMRAAPGKNSCLKEWPDAHWVELIEDIKKEYHVFLVGSGRDFLKNKNFMERHFNKDKKVHILKPRKLWQLAVFFAKASALISVNTGIMHLAAFMELPTIGLHGPTNPLRWGPAGKNCVSLSPESGVYGYLNLGFEFPPHVKSCMEFLTVRQVKEALHSLLSRQVQF